MREILRENDVNDGSSRSELEEKKGKKGGDLASRIMGFENSSKRRASYCCQSN